MAEANADLGGFLEAAGRSLVDAQGSLTGDLVDLPPAVAISEAELELKAAVVRARGRGRRARDDLDAGHALGGDHAGDALDRSRAVRRGRRRHARPAPRSSPRRRPTR